MVVVGGVLVQCWGGVRIESREWRGRVWGVSMGWRPGGMGVRDGRCCRCGQVGLMKGGRSESSEREGRAGRESVLWWWRRMDISSW